MTKRIVVCAACVHPNDPTAMCVGPRHWDKTMFHQVEKMGYIGTSIWKQGFIDQFGVFMDRKEAMIVAKASGQPLDLKRNGPDDTKLCSEGLY